MKMHFAQKSILIFHGLVAVRKCTSKRIPDLRIEKLCGATPLIPAVIYFLCMAGIMVFHLLIAARMGREEGGQ